MNKTVLKLVLVMLGATYAAAEPGSTDLGAIWFVGDSITQSNADGDSSGSPRKSLYDLLMAGGYSFTYTGHHSVNVDGLPTTGATVSNNLYHYHSGISGSMIGDDYGTRAGMTERMTTHWSSGRTAVVKPDIILIMLGTNDIGQEYDVANAPARLKALVQSIYTLPGVGSPAVYVANIPPSIGRSATQTANVIAFNAEVPGMVSDLQNEGKNVRFVDQYTALNADYANVMRSDNLHPNAAGNDVLAQHWFEAITNPEVIDEWPGTLSDFHGYDLYTFTTNGLNCKVAVPDVVAEGKPWVWRARFWGHQPDPDVALLGAGYHVAYVDVAGLFGSPTGVARFDAFYDFLTQEYGFDTRTVLEGMSRGGLAIYNWAAQNPDKVHCVYADAPVCDFKSWPAGFGTGSGSAGNWNTCKAAYGFASDAEAIAYGGNPVDHMLPLAQAGIPLLHVVGDEDTTVPVVENTALVESRYNALGGWIKVIHKPGVGHVHGLADPAPIIDFILNSMNEVHTLEATEIDETSATLNGLLSLPGTNYAIQVYWGTTDGGTNAAAWDQSASLGSWSIGDSNRVSFTLSSLTADSMIYYTFSATNSTESLWDDGVSFSTSNSVVSSVIIDGVFSTTDADFGSFASAMDLVNAGADTLASGPTYSATPSFGPAANNDGTVGAAATSSDITFWINSSAGNTYTITYALDTSTNTLGYDITSLQTIHGWKNNSGNQKNQNYTVEVSRVGDSEFTNIATVAYLPFSSADTAGSSKVLVSDNDTGILASGVDQIRFLYTVPSTGGTQPSPTIREIDVFGVPTESAAVDIPKFSAEASVSNGTLYAQFSGSIGSHYQVEYSGDLTSNTWQLVTTVTSLATSPMAVALPATNVAGFYRVIGLP